MNSKKRQQERDHHIASKLAFESECLLCGTSPCSPCHWPVHRGIGGAKAGWERHEWVPLCGPCHSLIDRRAGVSKHIEAQRRLAIDTLIRVTAREDY